MGTLRDRRGAPVPAYAPVELAKTARDQGLGYAGRWLKLGLAALGAGAWLVRIRRAPDDLALRVAFARWGRHRMAALGPVFVKLGQTLACRIDAFPQEVTDELALLHDRVPGFATGIVFETLAADLGGSAEDHFSYIDPQPLAAASMAQVHLARLPDGREVVIKVLRPGLQAIFAMDLTILRAVAGFLQTHPWGRRLAGTGDQTPWVGLVDHLGEALYAQLDLWREGHSGEDFAANFAGWPRVGAPGIVWTHSATRVLTQERVVGMRFDDQAAHINAGLDARDVAALGVRSFVKQVFADAYYHADTHPGNIFVTPAGRLVYIDFGLVETLEPAFQSTIVAIFLHAIQQDWEAFLDDMVAADIIPPEVPREALIPIFARVWGAQLGDSGERYTLQHMADAFYGVIRDYPFRLPERFIFLTRTAAALEAAIYRNDPDFKFLPVAMPSFAKLVLARIEDGGSPWILRDLLASARQEGLLPRLVGIVEMAMADGQADMAGLAERLWAVFVHPDAGALRDELRLAYLAGELSPLLDHLPHFLARPGWPERLQSFVTSKVGRDWMIQVVADGRFPARAASTAVDLAMRWGRPV